MVLVLTRYFFLKRYNKTFGQLPASLKAKISHRARALKKFRILLEYRLLQEIFKKGIDDLRHGYFLFEFGIIDLIVDMDIKGVKNIMGNGRDNP